MFFTLRLFWMCMKCRNINIIDVLGPVTGSFLQIFCKDSKNKR